MSLDRTDYKSLADKLWPYLATRSNGSVGSTGGSSGGSGMSAHDLAGTYHTGALARSQAPWVTQDITDHKNLPDAHHAKLHSYFSTADHTFPTAAAMDVIGFTAANTPGKLTPSSAPGTTEKLLKTNSTGQVAIDQIIAQDRLYVGGQYFDQDSTHLNFNGPGAFYITAASPVTYIYSADIYLGGLTGTTTHLRGNGVDSDDDDLNYTFGRAAIGSLGYTDYAGIAHRDKASAGNYALLQFSDGSTYLNSSSGKVTTHAIGGATTFQTGVDRVNPAGSMTKDLGDYNRKWRTGFFAELYAETLVAQYVMATLGGRITVAPTTKLLADMNNSQTTIDVENNNLHSGTGGSAVGHYLYMSSAPGGVPQIEAMKVANGANPTAITGGYRYTVTRNSDGTGANAWVTGGAVISTGGAVGHGYIDITATATIHNHFGPTITHYVRNSMVSWNSVTPVVTSGNLRSFVDYSIDEFGNAAGNDLTLTPSTGFKGYTLDRTDGLRLFNTALQMYTSGVKLLELNSNGLFLNDASSVAAFAAYIGSSPTTWGGISIAKGDVLIGNSTSYLWYDQSTTTVKLKGNMDITATSLFSGSGVLTAGNTKLSADGISVLGASLTGTAPYDPATVHDPQAAYNVTMADNTTLLGTMFGERHTNETAVYFHALPDSAARKVQAFFGAQAITTGSALAILQANNGVDRASIYASALASTDVTYPLKSVIEHNADLHFINGTVGINDATGTGATLAVWQSNATAALPVLDLLQADLSEEFINFKTTVGAGNPIDTAALGSYYGKIRVAVNGTFKYLALYN